MNENALWDVGDKFFNTPSFFLDTRRLSFSDVWWGSETDIARSAPSVPKLITHKYFAKFAEEPRLVGGKPVTCRARPPATDEDITNNNQKQIRTKYRAICKSLIQDVERNRNVDAMASYTLIHWIISKQ